MEAVPSRPERKSGRWAALWTALWTATASLVDNRLLFDPPAAVMWELSGFAVQVDAAESLQPLARPF